MIKKFCIVLFITIFCNGVAFSSPTKDLISKEQAAATEVATHINHKIEPKTTATEAGVHVENQNVSVSANSSKIEVKPGLNVTAVEKIINQGSNTTNDSKTTPDATVKSPDVIVNSLNATVNSPNTTLNNSNATVRSPNATVSGSPSNSSVPAAPTAMPAADNATDLPPKRVSDMLPPTVAGQSTTTVTGQSTTTVTTLAVETTTKAPATVVTPTPAPAVSTSTGNVVLVHDSSAKGQENRFDGASFVGGIVLTIGLTAIGFIAFKYYKSGKIDGNYRSL